MNSRISSKLDVKGWMWSHKQLCPNVLGPSLVPINLEDKKIGPDEFEALMIKLQVRKPLKCINVGAEIRIHSAICL